MTHVSLLELTKQIVTELAHRRDDAEEDAKNHPNNATKAHRFNKLDSILTQIHDAGQDMRALDRIGQLRAP